MFISSKRDVIVFTLWSIGRLNLSSFVISLVHNTTCCFMEKWKNVMILLLGKHQLMILQVQTQCKGQALNHIINKFYFYIFVFVFCVFFFRRGGGGGGFFFVSRKFVFKD